MEIKEMQRLVLAFMPEFHFRVIKPFKQALGDGVSLEMYYCIELLKNSPEWLTMSEFSSGAMMPKQQSTKMIDRLMENGFVKRVSDPGDRRKVRLELTEKGADYADGFLDNEAACFRDFFMSMSEADRRELTDAFKRINAVFERLPHDCPMKKRTAEFPKI